MEDKKSENLTTNLAEKAFERAWEYFKLHAIQRLTLFRFYMVFLLLFFGGIGFLLMQFYCPSRFHALIINFLSFIFLIITGIFSLLERRNRQLVGYAKDSLRILEAKFKPQLEKEFNFSEEEAAKICIFMYAKQEKSFITHSKCFDWIFNLGAALAIVLICLSGLSTVLPFPTTC